MTIPEVVTQDEILSYEQREAASPETGEFVGGHGVFVPVVILFAIAFVVVLLILDKKE
jgi:hypothetical protein